MKKQIVFYASTRTYQAVLAIHGREDLVPRLHAKSLAGDWEGMADLISDETLDHFAVSGSFATIGERIRERYRGL
ncbi:MAG TPA: LLM class flavin-dependent oxidoreductase [Methylomirabilota bacterium]|nr:LLM class flavin-dependent oxidoreductase [Methylomirabilota bacterium]